jgi:next-to-BRCA1 protein 1
MATNAPAPSNLVPVTLDTLIIVKVQFQANTRKFKIPLRDLGAQVFPDKVRTAAFSAPTAALLRHRVSE